MIAFAVEFFRDRDLTWLVSQPLFWAALGLVVGPYLFLRGFGVLRLRRRIMNIPQSTVRGAALGLVEMSGKATGPYTVVAPMSKEECLYYQLVVIEDEERRFANKSKEMCAPLFLDDGTGLQLIYPSGANLRLGIAHQEGSLGRALEGYQSGNSPDFIREYLIKEGDPIFVIGTLQENIWRKKTVSETSRIGPGFVSAAEADMIRSMSYSLNPDLPTGMINAETKFDVNPPTILTRGQGPFVVSSESQRDVLTKLGWLSLLFIWGGPIWTVWALYTILDRPEVLRLVGFNR